MKNLIKCHYLCLFNKNLIFIVSLSLILCTFIFFTNSFNVDNKMMNKEIIMNYYMESSIVMKLVFVFPTVLIFMSSISHNNDYYAYFILTYKISRVKYIVTKLLVLLLLILILYFILFIIFNLIGFIMIKKYYVEIMFLKGFFENFLVTVVYGFFGMLLMQSIQNIYSLVIIFSTFIVSQNIVSNQINDIFCKIFVFIFPTILDDGINSYYGTIHLLWLLMVLFIVNANFYQNKDLCY